MLLKITYNMLRKILESFKGSQQLVMLLSGMFDWWVMLLEIKQVILFKDYSKTKSLLKQKYV